MIRLGEVDHNFMVWAKKQGLNTTRQHEALAWRWTEATTEIIYQLWLAGAGVVEANQRRGDCVIGSAAEWEATIARREQGLYRAISNLELIVRG